MKVAVQLLFFAFVSKTNGVTTPEQSPLQPVNSCPVEGFAVNVIAVPNGLFMVHLALQVIPVGLLVTFPLPLTMTRVHELKLSATLLV